MADDQPPQLGKGPDGKLDINSVADIIEWFLEYDEKTSRIRHPNTNELFFWKQKDDDQNGIGTYPFENSEARFALGTIQAVTTNDSEPLLKLWISDVLEALNHAREIKQELTQA